MICQKQIDEAVDFLGQSRITAANFGVRNSLGQWLPLDLMNSRELIKGLSDERRELSETSLKEMRKYILGAINLVSSETTQRSKQILEQAFPKLLAIAESNKGKFFETIRESASENDLVAMSYRINQLYGSESCKQNRDVDQDTIEGEAPITEVKKEKLDREYKSCVERTAPVDQILAEFYKVNERLHRPDADPIVLSAQESDPKNSGLKMIIREFPILTVDGVWLNKYNHRESIDINLNTCQFHVAKYVQATSQYEAREFDKVTDYLKAKFSCSLPLNMSRNQRACELLY